MQEGPAVQIDPVELAAEGGSICPKHSQHWLAKVVRANRVNLGYPPQGCGCDDDPDDAHHNQVRADLEASRARLATRSTT